MISTTDELVEILETYDKNQDVFCAHDTEGNGYSHISGIDQCNIVKPYECVWNLKYGGTVKHTVLTTDHSMAPLSPSNLIEQLKKFPQSPLAVDIEQKSTVKTIHSACQEYEDDQYDVPLPGTGSCILLVPAN